MNPAVSVHHTSRDTIHNAVDGVANILVSSDQNTGTGHDQQSTFVMQSKDIVVDLDRIKLKVLGKIPKISKSKHDGWDRL